jgi:hypothetical protein
MKKTRILPQPESVADFKARIAIMMRQRETGQTDNRYSVIGAAHAHPCVVRGPGDQPTPSESYGNQE